MERGAGQLEPGRHGHAVGDGGGQGHDRPRLEDSERDAHTTKAPYTFTIPASVVQGWLSAPSSNNGILLADTTNFDGFVFDTKEGATPPKLTVNYTTGGGQDTTPPETTIDSGPSGTFTTLLG